MRNLGIKLTFSTPLLLLSVNAVGAILPSDLMIKPITDPYVNMPLNDIGGVKYLLTNKGKTSYRLQASPIQGLTQETGKPKLCDKDIHLSPGKSCILSYIIDGSEAISLTKTGPIVCEKGWTWSHEAGFDAKACIQPELNHRMSINFVSSTKATVSIRINNGKDEAKDTTRHCFASMHECALTFFKNNSTTKSITITNTSTITATDIHAVDLPQGVSQDASNCKVLNPNSSCKIYFKAASLKTLHTTVEFKGNNLVSNFMKLQVLGPGDSYRGGIIACMKGRFRNLIVASVDNSDNATLWGSVGILTHAISPLNGKLNTKKIIKTLGDNDDYPYAAQICANYEVDSEGNTPCKTGSCYDHWFLPANIQMNCIYSNARYNNRLPLGEHDYWTSTEAPPDQHPADQAYLMSYEKKMLLTEMKFQGAAVRCVSSFNP